MVNQSGVPADSSQPSGKPLAKALAQNEQVKDKVVAVAEELLVINTVLKQEISEQHQKGEVAQALGKHENLEDQVQECADELQAVNEALAEEVGEREKLERKLSESRAELAASRAALAGRPAPSPAKK